MIEVILLGQNTLNSFKKLSRKDMQTEQSKMAAGIGAFCGIPVYQLNVPLPKFIKFICKIFKIPTAYYYVAVDREAEAAKARRTREVIGSFEKALGLEMEWNLVTKNRDITNTITW